MAHINKNSLESSIIFKYLNNLNFSFEIQKFENHEFRRMKDARIPSVSFETKSEQLCCFLPIRSYSQALLQAPPLPPNLPDDLAL